MTEEQSELRPKERHHLFKPDPDGMLHPKFYLWLKGMQASLRKQREETEGYGFRLAQHNTTSEELKELSHVLQITSSGGSCTASQARMRTAFWCVHGGLCSVVHPLFPWGCSQLMGRVLESLRTLDFSSQSGQTTSSTHGLISRSWSAKTTSQMLVSGSGRGVLVLECPLWLGR